MTPTPQSIVVPPPTQPSPAARAIQGATAEDNPPKRGGLQAFLNDIGRPFEHVRIS